MAERPHAAGATPDRGANDATIVSSEDVLRDSVRPWTVGIIENENILAVRGRRAEIVIGGRQTHFVDGCGGCSGGRHCFVEVPLDLGRCKHGAESKPESTHTYLLL